MGVSTCFVPKEEEEDLEEVKRKAIGVRVSENWGRVLNRLARVN
jgi:hypothetical protein